VAHRDESAVRPESGRSPPTLTFRNHCTGLITWSATLIFAKIPEPLVEPGIKDELLAEEVVND
jgi:hypothetical protein